MEEENVWGLEISVKNALLVAEGHATQQLVQERLQIYGLDGEMALIEHFLCWRTFMVFFEMMPLC